MTKQRKEQKPYKEKTIKEAMDWARSGYGDFRGQFTAEEWKLASLAVECEDWAYCNDNPISTRAAIKEAYEIIIKRKLKEV